MADLIFHRYNAQGARVLRDTVAMIHRDAYADAIIAGDPFDSPEAFMRRFDDYTANPAFDMVMAYLGDETVGQIWGWPLRQVEPGVTDNGKSTFALSEIMVRRAWTGRGIAHARPVPRSCPCPQIRPGVTECGASAQTRGADEALLLGGTDNFTADHRAAEQILAAVPDGRAVARANRDFVLRAVQFMAASGIAQFIDLGAGIPCGPGIHDVARSVLPAARVVYVDADPVACTHWQALLFTDNGAAVVMADIRDPGTILAHPELNRLISFTRPVGVLFTAVLPFIGDTDADTSVAAFRQHMCPGSMLAVSHVTSDGTPPEVIADLQGAYSLAGTHLVFRTRARIEAFFGSLALAAPGLVDVAEWPDPRGVLASASLRTAAGVA